MSDRRGGRSDLQSCSCAPLIRPSGRISRDPSPREAGRGWREAPGEGLGDCERRSAANKQKKKVHGIVRKMTFPPRLNVKSEIDVRARRRDQARQPPESE